MLRFGVLGPLTVETDTESVSITAQKLRKALGLLVMRSPHFVSESTLAEELWDGLQPPRSARGTIQTYIYQLRRQLAAHANMDGQDLVVHDAIGYSLQIAQEQLDLFWFDQLYLSGRELMRDGRPNEASAVLDEALMVWRGAPLANVDTGPVLDAELVRLDEKHLNALKLRIDADIAAHHFDDLIPELQSLTSRHLLDEWFPARLVTVLGTVGRRADALRAYGEARRKLKEELGIDPSAELRASHLGVIRGDTVR